MDGYTYIHACVYIYICIYMVSMYIHIQICTCMNIYILTVSVPEGSLAGQSIRVDVPGTGAYIYVYVLY